MKRMMEMKKSKKKQNKKQYKYEPKPKVHCSNCPSWVNVSDVKFLNIEEDIQRVDVMTFECPKCKSTQKSRIFK